MADSAGKKPNDKSGIIGAASRMESLVPLEGEQRAPSGEHSRRR